MLPDTIQYQKTLADYCRTGKPINLPGITPNRLEHYHRLVNNIVYSTIEQAYPITRHILTDGQWRSLIDDFFATHDCKTPQVWKMPREFYEFVKAKKYAKTLDKPYLNDLLYFEWIEIEVHCMRDIDKPESVKKGNLAIDKIVFNPEYHLAQLEYPVHLTSDEGLLQQKGIYYLLVFRDYKHRNVHFVNLGIFPAVFITNLLEDNLLFETALDKTSEVLSIEVSSVEYQQLLDLLKSLKKQKFILGFAN